MKKFLSLVLALSMLLALAACGGGNTPANNTPNTNNGQNNQQTDNQQPDDSTGGAETRPNRLILGTGTKLAGELGTYAWFQNNATDYLIDRMVHGGTSNGYSTTAATPEGEFITNPTVVDGDIQVVKNEDGTHTVTTTILKDLTWNNGEPITAADYVGHLLIADSPQVKEAGSWNTEDTVVGGAEYQAGETNKISSLHLIDEYTFSFDISADYANYFYMSSMIGMNPIYLKKFSEDLVVKDDGDGAYLEGTFTKEDVERVRDDYNSPVTCGPYILKEADLGAYSATLEINPYYKGNFEGVKPSIEQIVIIYANPETQFDSLATGAINMVGEQGDGKEINKGLNMVDGGGYSYATYDRNGYGYLGFVCDGGPTQFKEVRHAVAYLLDRNEFCTTYTGGFGIVTNGPYGTGMWQYQETEEFLATELNSYTYDPAKAVEELVAGGWTLNEDGTEYSGEGVRWKKVTPEEAGDYKYNVTLADGSILMPLEIEWYTTPENSVSELLATMLQNGPQTAEAGMKINSTVMEFPELQNYTGRKTNVDAKYGGYNFGMFNMATGYSSIYDQCYYYVDTPDNPYDSWDSNKLYNKELYDTAYGMTMNTEPSDREGYLSKFKDFLVMWNDLLPNIPLYSNTYHTFFADWLKGYEPGSQWGFEYAIIYASIENAVPLS